MTLTTLANRPDAAEQAQAIEAGAWPEFLRHGDIDDWAALFHTFPEYQILLHNDGDELVGVGHCVPLQWDGESSDLPQSVDDIIRRAKNIRSSSRVPNTLSALAIVVSREHQRRGHSAAVVSAMRSLAAGNSLSSLIAPIRPILKAAYPLTEFRRYLEWQRPDGRPFDPWIRLHADLGATMLRTIPRGVHVEGTVAEWEDWTGLRFLDTGAYVVAGALQPVEINVGKNIGTYDDPNIWMQHLV